VQLRGDLAVAALVYDESLDGVRFVGGKPRDQVENVAADSAGDRAATITVANTSPAISAASSGSRVSRTR
jgi:hypothetical protein